MCEVDGQEPDMRRERWTSGRLVAKSIFIKDAKRRSGNCARKATELTPGGLLRVPTSELRAWGRKGVLTADAEVSEEGILGQAVGKASEALQGRKAEKQIGRAGNEGRRPERLRVTIRTDELMSGTRQKILDEQLSQTLAAEGRGEALDAEAEDAEPLMAKPAPESPALAERLMEEVCDRENLERAWKRVRSNKGSPGVDGMTIDAAKDYLREHWPNIRAQLLEGTYQPQPVKRVEIPKPDGGIRKLGVPCVVDRLIQQAMLQVLQERWDPTFPSTVTAFDQGAPPIRQWLRRNVTSPTATTSWSISISKSFSTESITTA